MSERRYLLSECCNDYVIVPVEVTAHLLVLGDGTVSPHLADRLSDVRRQARDADADVADAYCASCAEQVKIGTP